MRLNATPVATGLGLCFVATIVAASTGIPVPVDRLAAHADLVVEGTVETVFSGVDPERGTVATYTTVAIDRTLRGPAGLREIVIRQPGGRWGERVLVVDHVASFEPDEEVYIFLEAALDGALRPVGAFYGKFSVAAGGERGAAGASRCLEPSAPALARGETPRAERVSIADLDALALTVPLERAPRAWLPRPAEWTRLERQEEPGRFAADSGTPARWEQADVDMPVDVRVATTAGNPLHDAGAARRAVARALDTWTMVPEARVVLAIEDAAPAGGPSPAAAFTGVNTVVFGDPWDDIPDPVDCAGLLAIGGYWRAAQPGRTVNGVRFFPMLQLYVIVNDGFECFFSDEDNLAEVLAHEVGHGLGFGHSSAPDALMRAAAYGGRGPRLGLDDLDAVHCHYPHQFQLVSPRGGEHWGAGTMRAVRWESSLELAADAGTVALEISADAGLNWQPISTAERNDGYYRWRVPDDVAGPLSLRVVRHSLGGWLPANYPEACSQAGTKVPISIAGSPATGESDGARPLTAKRLSSR